MSSVQLASNVFYKTSETNVISKLYKVTNATRVTEFVCESTNWLGEVLKLVISHVLVQWKTSFKKGSVINKSNDRKMKEYDYHLLIFLLDRCLVNFLFVLESMFLTNPLPSLRGPVDK
jgi:hypothetical protein